MLARFTGQSIGLSAAWGELNFFGNPTCRGVRLPGLLQSLSAPENHVLLLIHPILKLISLDFERKADAISRGPY